MVVGFTGTRVGMSQKQKAQALKILLTFLRASRRDGVQAELHHGGAVGADREADMLAFTHGYAVHVHPCPGVTADDGPSGTNGRGTFNRHDVEWHEVLPPLKRNREIVDLCDLLIAAPDADSERLRSGTWATIRYARQIGKPIAMLPR